MSTKKRKLTPKQRVIARLIAITDEYCTAVDNAADDIGGSRPLIDILGELGPAVDAAMDAMPNWRLR